MCLGEFEARSGFRAGENPSHEIICLFFFMLGSVILLVVLMNMLIAIMGDTFIKNNEVEEQLLLKGKLKFIVDNWYMNKIALGEDKKRIKFIITALMSETLKDEEEKNFKEL